MLVLPAEAMEWARDNDVETANALQVTTETKDEGRTTKDKRQAS